MGAASSVRSGVTQDQMIEVSNAVSNIEKWNEEDEHEVEASYAAVLNAVDLIKDKGDARVKALNVIHSLSYAPEIEVYMASPELGLLVLLMGVVREDKGDARVKALNVIHSLSYAPEIEVYMASPGLGLLVLLMRVVREDKGDARVKALLVIHSLSTAPENIVFMASPELGLLALLMGVVREDKGDARVKALNALMNISYLPENKVYMASLKLGLLALLMGVVREDKEDAQVRMKVLGILWNLSLLRSCIPRLLECNCLQAVLIVLGESIAGGDESSELLDTCLTVLMVIGRDTLAGETLKLLGAVDLIAPLVDDTGIRGLKAAFVIAFMTGKDEASLNKKSLLEANPNMADLLSSVLSNSMQGKGGPGYTFGIFNLNVIVAAILSLSVSDSNKSILVSKPLLRPLRQVLHFFCDDAPQIPPHEGVGTNVGGGGDDVESAETAIECLHQLSFHYEDDGDLCKSYMTPDLQLAPLLSALLGIQDTASAATGAEKKKKKIQQCEKLSEQSKQTLQNLLRRLVGKDRDKADATRRSEETSGSSSAYSQPVGSPVAAARSLAASSSSSTVGTIATKHIMLSYAWTANKNLVIALGAALRKLGHVVWRDEEGSPLLSPMSGSTDDVMADAIEKSSTVIICVSKQYKLSTNCHQEAAYANARKKKGLVKLLYVLMDAAYTTHSTPDAVDGWLGIMLGDALWYPLWNPDQLASTSAEIAKLLVGDASVGDGGLGSGSYSPTKESPVKDVSNSSALAVVSNPLDAAWKLLIDASKVAEPDRLATIMREIGLTESSELRECDDDMVNSLASCLRPIPKKVFVRNIAECR